MIRAPLRAAALLFALASAAAAPAQQQTPARQAKPPNAAAGATAPTHAAVVDPGEAARLFSRFDTDRDGRLSEAELAAARTNEGNWIAVDRNRDGRITRDEFTALARE